MTTERADTLIEYVMHWSPRLKPPIQILCRQLQGDEAARMTEAIATNARTTCPRCCTNEWSLAIFVSPS
jgi:hypothetical protein